MTNFVFDDFVKTTIGGAKNAADGGSLSQHQINRVVEYIKSPGSGPDGTTSFSEFVEAKMRRLPPELPPGVDYVAFSGTDSFDRGNYYNAADYSRDLKKSAGIIGDTPWGKYVQELEDFPGQDREFAAMEEKLQTFLTEEGVKPHRDSAGGALRDMMWNAGSPKFFENAIATGKPLVAFVENAPDNRGFSNFELETALEHPNVRINGYPVSSFGPDPLAFVSRSAAEYQSLERSLYEPLVPPGLDGAELKEANEAALKTMRQTVKPIEGYDAVAQTLYDRPVAEFKSLSLNEMGHARTTWIEAGGRLSTGPHLQAEVPEHHPVRTPGEPGSARGSPAAAVDAAADATAVDAAAVKAAAAEATPHPTRASMSTGTKAGIVAGVAFLAQDFAVSGHKWVELHGQGNAAGASSTAAHFVGRNVGGALGGFVAGAGVGLTTGSWTGPGALITGIGGGALGAYLGERWADQKDIDRIYTQKDSLGREWERSPTDPEGRWMRAADQQRVQGSDLGTGVEVRPVQTALGQDVTFQSDYVAVGMLERQLNWKAATESYGLGLANPPAPKDPYRLNAYNDAEPRGAFETERAFVRDPGTRQWQLEITEAQDGRAHMTRVEPVSAETAAALDEQSRVVIAQNAANTPAAMAARYMVAYEQQQWSDFGDKEHPSIPTAIQHARDSADTLRASDGNTYARQDDGQWTRSGVLGTTVANRNVGEELEVTWQSQKQGVEGLAEVAAEARENRQLGGEGVRGRVEALYAEHRIERTEEQLAAATVAVTQTLGADTRQTDVVLELMKDPRTNAYSPESAIAAFADVGGIETLRGTITSADVARVIAERQNADAQAAPIQNAPERSISALTPDQWDAHQQAVREANRQGASEEEVARAAMAAAQQAGGQRPDPVQVAQPEAEQQRPQVAPPQVVAEPKMEVAALAAAQASAIPVAPPPAQQAGTEQPTSVQPAQAKAEQERAAQEHLRAEQERQRQEEARATDRDTSLKEQEAYRAPLAQQQPGTEVPLQQDARHVAQAQEAEIPKVPVEAEPVHAMPAKPEVTVGQPPVAPTSALVSDDWERSPAATAPAFEQHRDLVDERRLEPAAQDHAVEPLHELQRPPAAPFDPREPGHPDHRLYEQIRGHVARLDEGLGRQYDATSERLTGSLLVLAKDKGLQRVDNVLLSEATPTVRAGQNVFLVQGESDDPAHKRAAMSTQEAVTSPFEQSMQKLDVLAREDQVRTQGQAHQQQEEHNRTQQERNAPMMMG